MLVVHATKKLRDRLKSAPRHTDEASTTTLGSWYATALFWRPQVALFVNESTLLPVLVPLAPAATVVDRFVAALGTVLDSHGAIDSFAEAEMTQMGDWRLSKTANRSVVGVMNEFSDLADVHSQDRSPPTLLDLSLRLSKTPCSPLYKDHGSLDRALIGLLSERGGF